MKRLAISLLMLFGVSTICWADSSEISLSGNREYKAVRLVPEIYHRSHQNLSDLLIQDEDGKPVPYFIHRFEVVKSGEKSASHPLTQIASFVKDGDTFIDFYAKKDPQVDLLATSFVLSSPYSLFAKNIHLYGSYDGIVWDFIQKDKLYRVDEASKLEISFAKPLKYTYLRIQILQNSENIHFGQARLEYNQMTAKQEFFSQTFQPRYEVEEKNKTTTIKIYGVKNLRIYSLKVDTDSHFKRAVSFGSGNSKMLYRLDFNGNSYDDLILPFDGYRTGEDFVQISIFNGDDKPIQIKNLTLSYLTDEIIFKGKKDGHYRLSFGDPSKQTAPIYDIVHYKEMILKEGYDLIPLGEIEVEIPKEEAPPADYFWLFNGAVIVVSLLLGYIILRRVKKT